MNKKFKHILKQFKGYAWSDLSSVISLYDSTALNKEEKKNLDPIDVQISES